MVDFSFATLNVQSKERFYSFLSCDFLIIFTANEEKGKGIKGGKHNMSETGNIME